MTDTDLIHGSSGAEVTHTPRFSFDGREWMLGVAWFLVLLGTQFGALDQPPIWDSANGLWVAADWLAENGFDIPLLLQQDVYVEGGPNIHTFAPLTWVTAVAVWALPEAAVFPVLHVLNFALAGWIITMVYRFARGIFGPTTSLLLAVAAMTVPTVMVQSTYMYLELPTLAAAMAAVLAWRDDRRVHSVLWLVLAVMLKPNAAAFGLALALATLSQGRNRRNWRLATAYTAIPLVLILARGALGEASALRPSVRLLGPAARLTLKFLQTAPDILIIFVIAGAMLPLTLRLPHLGKVDEETSGRVRHEILIVSATLSFGLASVAIGALGQSTLTRYWTMVLPLMVIGVGALLRRFAREPVVRVIIVLLILFSIANMTGGFYTADSQNYAVLERSFEFRDQLEVDLLVADRVSALDGPSPIIYANTDAPSFELATIGYVDEPITNGVNVHVSEAWDFEDLEMYPQSFYLVLKYDFFGGTTLEAIAAEAEASPAYDVTTERIAVGSRDAEIVRVTRR